MKLKKCSIVLSLALSFSGLLAGCNASNQDNSSANPDTSVAGATNNSTMSDTNETVSNGTGTTNRDADNSGINVRDRDTNNLTPGDQGNTAADIDITQKIRKGLVMDSNYSMTAKNIKIITVDGKVTLRGPVNSDTEKAGIESIAKNIAGDGNVDNQLEVKSNP
jgi:hyperosmotically inducible periplasmic protein